MTDNLRARIAEAIRGDLMKAVPPWEPVPGVKLSPGMGRTEFDLADAVMAALHAKPGSFEARMTLHMSDCDPIATCACGVRCFGDSINDALLAWGKHLTTVHRDEEW